MEEDKKMSQQDDIKMAEEPVVKEAEVKITPPKQATEEEDTDIVMTHGDAVSQDDDNEDKSDAQSLVFEAGVVNDDERNVSDMAKCKNLLKNLEKGEQPK